MLPLFPWYYAGIAPFASPTRLLRVCTGHLEESRALRLKLGLLFFPTLTVPDDTSRRQKVVGMADCPYYCVDEGSLTQAR
jgi:hypothetical protein